MSFLPSEVIPTYCADGKASLLVAARQVLGKPEATSEEVHSAFLKLSETAKIDLDRRLQQGTLTLGGLATLFTQAGVLR